MAEVKVERVLVQGTVTFTVSFRELKGMVTPEQAADEEFMKDWFADKAFKMIDSADEDVCFENEVSVMISKETADKYTGKIVDSCNWKEIVEEHRKA